MRSTLPVGAYGAPAKEPARGMSWFSLFASQTAQISGRPITFLVAAAVVVIWGVTGPIFNYSDTWQLVINTGTTIITFLMVFLIQHTQNRDTLALQLKLDELIVATKAANNDIAAIEERTEEELEKAKAGLLRRVAVETARPASSIAASST